MSNKKIDDKEFREIFREVNGQCNKVDCEKGDFQECEFPEGAIICQDCMMPGINFGKPMVMPENFEMPSMQKREWII